MIGVFQLILAAVLWGMIGPVSKIAFQNGITPLEVAFWRGLLGGALFLGEAFARKNTFPRRNDLLATIGFAILGVAGLEASNLITVQDGGAAFASVMLYGAPIWVAIFSRMFFGERLSSTKILAIFLAVGGVAGVAFSGSSTSLSFSQTAIIFGVISGLSYALFYIFGKIYFGRFQPAAIYGLAFPLASLAIFPFVTFAHKNTESWLVLLFNGVVSTYLAYFFYSRGLKKIEATRAAVITSLEPVVSAVLAYVMWNEVFSTSGYVFSGLVFLGIFLMIQSRD